VRSLTYWGYGKMFADHWSANCNGEQLLLAYAKDDIGKYIVLVVIGCLFLDIGAGRHIMPNE